MHRLKILLVPCRRIVVCAHSGGVEKFLVASCHRNLDMLLPDGLLGSY